MNACIQVNRCSACSWVKCETRKTCNSKLQDTIGQTCDMLGLVECVLPKPQAPGLHIKELFVIHANNSRAVPSNS